MEILLVEDSETDARLVLHELRRCGFAPSWERVENAADLSEALRRRSWHVVISDSSMPQLGALDALALTRSIAPTLPFIVVSGSVHPDAPRRAVEAGAAAWISKDDLAPLGAALRRGLELPREPEGPSAAAAGPSGAMPVGRVVAPLITAARDTVAEVATTVAPGAAARLNDAVALLDDATLRLLGPAEPLDPPRAAAAPALTPRQLEVLRLIAAGRTTREIGGLLGVSVKTVETHRGQIMERLGTRTVAGLVRYAMRSGLADAEE